MERRTLLLGMASLGAVGCGDRTSADGRIAARPVPPEEQRQTIAALRPPKRRRPLVAIVADNRGCETTDLMIPYGVLRRSGLADVAVIAPDVRPIAMMPALSIQPQSTLDAFDLLHPDGADYVIVPAFHHDDRSGPILDWLRGQAASHATVIGICEGAKVLGRAGLLDGRRATTHWYAASPLRRRHPTMQWVPDRRYVVDRGIATTTGVTASLPLSLALVEAIGGPRPAAELSAQLGVNAYDAAHRSDRFGLTAQWLLRLAGNSAAVWNHETIGVPLADGADDIVLGLTADAWSRTYRSKIVTIGTGGAIKTRDGLTIPMDRSDAAEADFVMPLQQMPHAAHSLDLALSNIASRYGTGTAGLVALQLEYAWPAARHARKAGS